ncbi:hypothetical protein QWZ16_23830 [Vibrio ostreicida]|uniref:Uncharacterized protein n=1 Tax=Vibrio ostreicida TaxID=526588 RepID=A0ABT8C114_9VIBR|nr:hypothetical protein [Vibrio ostreicida]MDN3612628.1 hypothetical protein [Vibrio ostreicida]
MIINEILETLPDDKQKESLRKLLNSSRIKDITEYGRVVHAEMEAILACARSDIAQKMLNSTVRLSLAITAQNT